MAGWPDLAHGHVELEVIGEDDARDEHHHDGVRRVLEVGQRHLHGPELGAPADPIRRLALPAGVPAGVSRWGLPMESPDVVSRRGLPPRFPAAVS